MLFECSHRHACITSKMWLEAAAGNEDSINDTTFVLMARSSQDLPITQRAVQSNVLQCFLTFSSMKKSNACLTGLGPGGAALLRAPVALLGPADLTGLGFGCPRDRLYPGFALSNTTRSRWYFDFSSANQQKSQTSCALWSHELPTNSACSCRLNFLQSIRSVANVMLTTGKAGFFGC